MTSKHDPVSPIAIIGMGLRLPGGISTTQDFWDLLVNKRDGKCRVPSSRYNVDAFSGEKTHQQKVATDYGYFLDANLGAFDTSFFSVKRAEIDVTDPQLRLLLEVVWECMESAGQANLRGTNTGVFVGVFGEDWHNMLHKDTQMKDTYRVLSAGDYALSNMLSYEYDFSGPSMTIRTACSSSMSSLHVACQALRNGDCPTAIVAGSSVIMDPTMTLDMSEQGVLSPSGSCKTFDAAADGFARGEAVNAILLKPLDDAIRDGDPIRAVIRSTAVNSDGKTSHIGSPSSEAQASMIRRAYEAAGIDDFSMTPFIECHGTGTVRGDPIEVAAVASIFGERGAYIGSVKPNLGHGEGAAALTSIIKAVLSLENETIPPNINFTNPNPKIPFQEYKLEVPVEPIPWPKDRHARVSVSAFGFGGANGHVILDSAASFGIHRSVASKLHGKVTKSLNVVYIAPSDESSDGSSDGCIDNTPDDSSVDSADEASNKSRGPDSSHIHQGSDQHVKDSVPNRNLTNRSKSQFPRLLSVSASTAKSLQSRVEGLCKYMEVRSESLDDLAYTLGLKRAHLTHRTFAITRDGTATSSDFTSPQRTCVNSTKGDKIAYVFTGQGAQWFGMGQSLVQGSPTFLKDIRTMDCALQQLEAPPQWTIEGLILSYPPSLQPERVDNSDSTIAFLSCTDDTIKESIDKSEFAQPLCTALQIAIVNFLAKSGIEPSAVIGHSSGEIAAAYTAGALTMSEAIICAYLRGLVTKRQDRIGSMAAIGMGRDEVLPYIVSGAVVACENSPKSVTISGDSDAVQQTINRIMEKNPDIFTRKLHVNVAYHSHHMRDIGVAYQTLLAPHLSLQEVKLPFYSTVLGSGVAPHIRFGPEYWKNNLESPVLFHTAMEQLLKDLSNVGTIVEIGPHAALQGPVRQILQDFKSKSCPTYVPTLIRNKDSAVSALTTIGQMYVRGHAVDFSYVNPMGSLLTDLPNYPWDHDNTFWKESRFSLAWRSRRHPHHELLGSRCVETTDQEPLWRNVLHHYDVPWLVDHKLGTNIVFPAAGYMSMMGEALRQVLGSDGYMLQSVMVKSALLLPQDESIEIMTSMRPFRLTGATNSSSWYEFSISTFNGKSWVENCIAQGKVVEYNAGKRPAKTIQSQLRKVPENYFYDRMQYIGFKYGPRFRGLKDVSTHTDKQIAVASIRNDESQYEATYAVHPTIIDCCLQLGAVAESKGIARNMNTLGLPVDVQCVTVIPGGPDLVAEAILDGEEKVANIVAVAKETNEIVVKLDNGRGIPFDTGDDLHGMDAMHAARLEWLPDIDCLDAIDLIKGNKDKRLEKNALERVSIAIILQLRDILESLEDPISENWTKYVSWLNEQTDIIAGEGHNQIVPEAKQWIDMPAESRRGLLDRLINECDALGEPKISNIARTLQTLTQREKAGAIFTDSLSPMEMLLENNSLADFYDLSGEGHFPDEFLRLCSHSTPTLKVLEIGAGTGGATEIVLRSLVSKDGVRMYSQYIFTDLSPGFFTSAKNRFKDRPAIEYKVLDIRMDPAEQGFELGSFDLVVASNVLHATSSLSNTLKNVRSLLRPGGRLYLQELVAPITWRFITLFSGLLPGWWHQQDDGRLDGPCVSVERWKQELVDADFLPADIAVLDEDEPYGCIALIIGTASSPVIEQKPLTFLYKNEKNEFGSILANMFEQEGIPIQWVKFGDKDQYTNTRDVISTIDLEGPYFDNISEQDYATFMEYLSGLKKGVLWLTRAAQIGCVDPRYGVGVGLLRTTRLELGVDFWTAELQTLDSAAAVATMAICRKFRGRSPMDSTQDAEYSVHDGIVRIGRYHWTSTARDLESQLKAYGTKQLVIGQYGSIDSLHWVQHSPAELLPDEVEVEVRSVGLNFRDVMVAMGIVPDHKDSIGGEAAGVITRVGTAVGHLKIGQSVFFLGSGLFTTHKVISGQHAIPFPDKFSFEEAVTMPLVYATALHAIMGLGHLEKGQSILIHSATGGVGQAAINISQMLGAEIYATVGSEEKVQHLIDTFGISRERIFHSRNDSFLDGVMQATGNRGVDIVLNSLSGDLLQASWKCVAKCGKMLEIGKRDMLEHGRLALDMFQHNRSFFGIDLKTLYSENHDRLLDLLKKFSTMGAEGYLKPIQPIHAFSALKLTDAFRFMKKGQHIGKIIVTMPQDCGEIPATVAPHSNLFSSTSTYLMIGGLGGLGKEVTRWMVEKGARSFCFLSRSAGNPDKDGAFFTELESQGCCVTAIAGSVAEMSDVKKAIAASPTPIAGVLQMSMVLRDLPLLEIGHDDWKAVQDPKVKGTWNLHNALSGTKLDFFVLIASVVGIIGQPGQANYASANSFLDSFMQYRHSLGLPCSVVDLGGMDGIGFLMTRPDKLHQYRSNGLFLLQEHHLMEAIQIAINRSAPGNSVVPTAPRSAFTSMSQLAVGLRSNRQLSDPRNRVLFGSDPRFSLYSNLTSSDQLDTEARDEGLRDFLNQAEANPEILNEPDTLQRVSWEIGRTLFSFLLLPEEDLDINVTLESIGVDSLVSIEIRNWWRRTLGGDITVLEILNAGTVEGLGKIAISTLKDKYSVKKDDTIGKSDS